MAYTWKIGKTNGEWLNKEVLIDASYGKKIVLENIFSGETIVDWSNNIPSKYFNKNIIAKRDVIEKKAVENTP